MNYQNLTRYNGTLYGEPRYQGLEYDFEVPDTQIIQSPGGASTTHHHWSKGFYGVGRSDPNKYGFQGYRNEYGINGNMYQPGPGAADTLGIYPEQYPDPRYWNNQAPPPTSKDMGEGASSFFDSIEPAEIDVPENMKKESIIETFSDDVTPSNTKSKIKTAFKSAIYFIVSVLSVIMFTLFAIKYYEQSYGRQVPNRFLLIMGVITLIATTIIYWSVK